MGDFGHESLHRVYDLTLINTSQGLVLNPTQPENLSLSLPQNNKPLSLNQNTYLIDHSPTQPLPSHLIDHAPTRPPPSHLVDHARTQPPPSHLIDHAPTQLDHPPPSHIDNNHQIAALSQNVPTPPPSKILFKAGREEFWKCVGAQYNCEQSSDCLLVCVNGVRLVATIVIAAASSLIRRILTDVRRGVIDDQITIILPDICVQDVDSLLLALYGAGSKYLDISSNLFNMFGVDFNIGCNLSEEEIIPEPDLVKLKELATQWRCSKNSIFPTFMSYLSASFREADSQDLTPKTNLASEKIKPIRRRLGKFNNVQDSTKITPDVAGAVIPEVKQENRFDNLLIAGTNDDDDTDQESDSNNIDINDTIFDDLDNFADPKVRQKGDSFLNCSQDSSGLYCCSVSNCGYKSGVKASFFVHGRKTHVARKYKDLCHWCSKCGEWWSNRDIFQKHTTEDDCQNVLEWPYVCEGCGRGWFNLRIYTDHMENALEDISQCSGTPFEHAPERNSCDYCPERFYSRTNLNHHVKFAHRGYVAAKYECNKCQLTWNAQKDWIDHKKSHKDDDLCEYHCEIANCDFQSDEQNELVDHLQKEHSEVVFVCKICGIDYKTEASLKRHEDAKHSEVRGSKKEAAMYYCSKCPKFFTTKGYLNQHNLFKHSDVRAFSCDQCGKSFKSKHCVNIHLRSHGIGGQMWTCEQCGKSFKQISSYHQHLHVHSDIREFACEICGKAFKMKSNLKKHLKLHLKNPNYTPTNNDAKVYSCDICGKKFKRADNLNAHKKKHVSRPGENQFKIEGENGHLVIEGGIAHVKLEGVLGVSHPQGVAHHSQEHHRAEEMPLVLSHDPLALVDHHHQVACDLCQWSGTASQYIHHKKMHAYSMGFRVPGT